MRTAKRALSLLLAVCCALSLSACGADIEDTLTAPEDIATPVQPTDMEPEEEPALLPDRFALPYEPDGALDPVFCPDGMQQVVSSLMYEGLFRLDGSLEPVPCLCGSYAYDPGKLTWTFVLREGLTFSDGSPVTAKEVIATLNAARNSQRYASRLRRVASVTGAGDTVFVALSAPNTAFPALMDIPIRKETSGQPVGTGPYVLKWQEDGMWLYAREDWWQGGGQPVERIFLEESHDAMLYRFTSGDVHLIVSNLIAASSASITGDIRYADAATTSLHYLACNVSRWPLSSAVFRKALSLGINRDNLTDAFLSGHALPAQFPVSPASALYPAGLEIPYASGACAAALHQMGYAPERTLSLLVNGDNPFKTAVAEELARVFTDAGAPTQVSALPWEEYQAAVAARDFDLCYAEGRLTADWDLSPLLQAAGSLNLGGWSDWRTAQLIAACAAATDRPAAVRELCAYLQETAPVLPVCFANSTALMQAAVVENLKPTAAEPFYNLRECVIHLREGE